MYVAFTVLYAKYYDKTQTNKAMGTIGAVVEVGDFTVLPDWRGALPERGIKSLFFISFCVAAAGTLISFL